MELAVIVMAARVFYGKDLSGLSMILVFSKGGELVAVDYKNAKNYPAN